MHSGQVHRILVTGDRAAGLAYKVSVLTALAADNFEMSVSDICLWGGADDHVVWIVMAGSVVNHA